MFLACGKEFAMSTDSWHGRVQMVLMTSTAVLGKTFSWWWSLLSPWQQEGQQDPEQPTTPPLQKRIPWAQVSNIVLGLRTDFLIPLPQSPCRYWGRPAPLDRTQSSQGLSAGTQPSLLWYQPPYFVSSLSLWQTFPPSWAECHGAAPHLGQVTEPSLSSKSQLPPLVFTAFC